MKGDVNSISYHQSLRHISRYSYYSSFISSLGILNISQCFWNLLKLLYKILNDYCLQKKMFMFGHSSVYPGVGNSCPSVYFCLWHWVFGVLGDKWWGLRKTLEYLSLQAEATFYRLLESAEIKVWLNPCENELEILWGENVILVSIITDVIIWLHPEEVLQFRTACISFFFSRSNFFFLKLSWALKMWETKPDR